MGKRRKKTIEIGVGENCPKCRRSMKRYEHGENWKPKSSQPYYFRFWDKCAPCKHLQHYEKAKVNLAASEDAENLDAEFRELMRS